MISSLEKAISLTSDQASRNLDQTKGNNESRYVRYSERDKEMQVTKIKDKAIKLRKSTRTRNIIQPKNISNTTKPLNSLPKLPLATKLEKCGKSKNIGRIENSCRLKKKALTALEHNLSRSKKQQITSENVSETRISNTMQTPDDETTALIDVTDARSNGICNMYESCMEARASPVKGKIMKQLIPSVIKSPSGYSCKVCSKSFQSRKLRNNHEKYVHNKIRLMCTICNKSLKSYAGLRRHKIRFHSTPYEELKNMNTDKNSSRLRDKTNNAKESNIRMSKKQQTSRNVYNKHSSNIIPTSNNDSTVVIDTRGNSMKCDINDRSPKTQANPVKRKIKKAQNVANSKFQSGYSCKICNKCFQNKKDRNRHEKYVHSTTWVNCETCSKSFKSEKYLRFHKRVVHSSSSVICNLCNKSFTHSNYLVKHTRLEHRPNSRRPCKICNATPQILSRHVKRHNMKKSKCQLCCKKVKDIPRHLKNQHPETKIDETIEPNNDDGGKMNYDQNEGLLILDENVVDFNNLFSCPFFDCDEKFISIAILQDHIKVSHESQ